MKKICLLLIVRDEAPVIKRCIDSVKNVIDGYFICDTGSVDGTPEIITEYMKELNIPGKVVYEEWKNFAHNRSRLFKRARNEVESKYFCWLDADEVYLNTETNEFPSKEDGERLFKEMESMPKVGIFYLVTHFGNLKYPRWNMVRNNQLYSWKCPVHEYLVQTKPTGSYTFTFIKLLARKEGNSSRDPLRILKDVLMLRKAYLENPKEHPRECFYLAQSYQDAGDYDLALKYYEERQQLMGFYQEKYIAMLRSGRLYTFMKKPEEAKKCFMRAHKIATHRIEALYEWMKHHYDAKEFDLAFEIGKKYKFPQRFNEGDLFVEPELYNWKFLYVASLSALECHKYDQAEEWAKKVLEMKKYPEDNKKLLENNLKGIEVSKGNNNRSLSLVENDSQSFNNIPFMHVVVIDDFLEDPDKERAFALSQTYDVKGNYPGIRTKSFATEKHKQMFENILQRKITYWPAGYNGSYQKATKNLKSWIHRDLTDYAGIIYLTPDAPLDSGTTFYRHKELKVERENPSNKKKLDGDSGNSDAWEVVDSVANKYNRLIIFNGRRSHSSTSYFGDCDDNCRLFQLFFFNVEKR